MENFLFIVEKLSFLILKKKLFFGGFYLNKIVITIKKIYIL